ncbi:MAG: hypothetical protein ABIF01_04095 [Candidatus Micrarchaeota archaeon]
MVPFRDFILRWVLPKDEKTLWNLIALMEITKLILAAVFIYTLATSLSQTDLVKLLRCIMFTAIAFIFIFFLSVIQYLMAIEFNTRKKV